MKDQMDKMSRPKLVMMEAGGNDADFYPLADACLFHAEGKDYGKKYEDDKGPVGKREGLCKYEIDQVRDRLTGDRMAKFQAAIRQTIHDWRGHKSVKGNDATLMTVGYARFFAEGKECDDMKFTIPGASEQKVVLDMRKDINELVSIERITLRDMLTNSSPDWLYERCYSHSNGVLQRQENPIHEHRCRISRPPFL
jgi:hypothetical protein